MSKVNTAEKQYINGSIIGDNNYNFAHAHIKGNVILGMLPEQIQKKCAEYEEQILFGVREQTKDLREWVEHTLLSKIENIAAQVSQTRCKEIEPNPLYVPVDEVNKCLEKAGGMIVEEIKKIVVSSGAIESRISDLRKLQLETQSSTNRIYSYCEEILSLTKAITNQLGALGIKQNEIKEILQISIDTAAKRQEEIIYSMNRQYDIELNIQAQQHLDSGVLAAIFDMVKKLSDKRGQISDERDEISKFISDLKTQNYEFSENIHTLVKANNEFRHIAQKIMDALIATSMPLWGNGLPPAEMRLYRNTDLNSPNPCPFCGAEYGIHFETDGRCTCKACGQEFSNLRSNLSLEDLSHVRDDLRDLCPTQTKVDSWRNGHTAKLEPIDGQAGHYRMSFGEDTKMEMRRETDSVAPLVVIPTNDTNGFPVHQIISLIYEETWRTRVYTIKTLVVNRNLKIIGTHREDPLFDWGLKLIVVPNSQCAIELYGRQAQLLISQKICVIPLQNQNTIIPRGI